MSKRLLLMLLPCLASSCSDRPKPSGNVQTIDLKDALYSLPTLCDPGPAVDATPPSDGARSLHEDDWRQIEFVARTNLAHMQQELARLTAFKQEHRRDVGWTQVYVRKEHPTPFATIRMRATSLPRFQSLTLVIGSGPPWGGTVRGGFALTDGADWFIYGQRSEDGHLVQLAVSPGRTIPSDQFAHALSQIALSADLLLIDWYAVSIVDTSSSEAVLTWARHYQKQ